jgi:ubiquinone/menaquinone biosynthesis C-methylase UbiE
VDQQGLSVQQFDASASNYLTSPVHAKGDDLERLRAIAEKGKPTWVLDLGCGAGHASFALARGGARRITAFDPSSKMLAVVAQEAATRGHDAIETLGGAAEMLPFDNGSFDLVVTRYSAHHWACVPRALAESARVLVPKGQLVVIDVIAPETPLFDTALQVLEFLRDASHVRDYRMSEWMTMHRDTGFAVPTTTTWKMSIDFDSWISRIGTPPARVAALRTVLAELPNEVRQHFHIGAELSFVTDSVLLESFKIE